ncbi:uncharacterized protein LOC131310530 isoform X2 [Rhododendron vialii]|uniref:uncharacterized protein LOC131310530 isoform X2 n=1 Tax=Rhododendron vialii TaxID=182163 RepID=UPI00265E82D2|nr:uncharacterized protein LOC131310530 isoform X2 [Rhododendron vialii]
MRGKGKSVAHSKSRTCSGRKTLKRCKNKWEADNVVLIDVDSDDFDNVIIVDVPESLKQKLQGGVLRKGKKCLIGTTVICIDDDDDDDSDTSCSGRFSPASSDNQNSANEVGDDCQFVPEKFPPLNLSKSKRTYSGKVFNGNRYGDSYSSDNDSPDCEVMEDSFGKLREQWEKANMKKKSDVRNGQFGRGDQVSTSELRNGTQHDVEVENITNQPTEANVPISSNASSDKGKPSGDSSYRDEPGSKQVNTINRFSPDREHTLHADYRTSNPKPTVDPDFGCSKDNLPDEEGSYFRTQHSVDKEVGGGGREENIEQTPSSSSHFPNEFKSGISISPDKEKSVDEEPSFHNIRQSDGRQNVGVMDVAVGNVPGGTYCEDPPFGEPELRGKNGCYQEEAQNEREMRTRELSGEFMPDHLYEEPDVTFHAQDGDVVNAVDNCIINEREKLKETDEYKRAVEEEWVSRQRELQLQAEEAQKLRLLRKRMKAESLRLLDMERRQKQRVEEIREVQKQDEEKMNLKEQIRAEVRKELKLLEIMCRDMASLLRGLGIQVGGGFHSPPQECSAWLLHTLLRVLDQAPSDVLEALRNDNNGLGVR